MDNIRSNIIAWYIGKLLMLIWNELGKNSKMDFFIFLLFFMFLDTMHLAALPTFHLIRPLSAFFTSSSSSSSRTTTKNYWLNGNMCFTKRKKICLTILSNGYHSIQRMESTIVLLYSSFWIHLSLSGLELNQPNQTIMTIILHFLDAFVKTIFYKKNNHVDSCVLNSLYFSIPRHVPSFSLTLLFVCTRSWFIDAIMLTTLLNQHLL